MVEGVEQTWEELELTCRGNLSGSAAGPHEHCLRQSVEQLFLLPQSLRHEYSVCVPTNSYQTCL